MAKTLFLYSLPGEPSDTMRNQLQVIPLSFTELRLDRDLRKHSTAYPGEPVITIDVGGGTYAEFTTAVGILDKWNAAPTSLPATPVPPLTPDERDQQAAAILTRKNHADLTELDKTRIQQLILKGMLNGGKL